MKQRLKKKILTTKFKEKIEEIFSNMSSSQKGYINFLYKLATHDEKTGLYNSNFFNTILEMEIEKVKRTQKNFSLFLIDIDFFKRINDSYGHIKADELMLVLVRVLRKQLRKSDVISRFGGEEFFILLPETNLEKAKLITSRLRDAIKEDKILKKHNLTVSGGLTHYKKSDTLKSLEERADKAMYKAKQTGRDRFIAVE
jgi:diguanylate cyclase (GGDEF)-like protein